jgi:hypothetical protein
MPNSRVHSVRPGGCPFAGARVRISRRLAHIFVFAVALLAPVATASAADVSGTWNVDGSVYGNALKYTLTLK